MATECATYGNQLMFCFTFNNGVEINRIKRAGFRSSDHIRMMVTMQNKAKHFLEEKKVKDREGIRVY